MSKEQSGGSMLIIVKELFNIEWKSFDQDATEVDLDTMPDTKRIRAMGKAREALALSSIVEKMMNSEERATIVYHDDGS